MLSKRTKHRNLNTRGKRARQCALREGARTFECGRVRTARLLHTVLDTFDLIVEVLLALLGAVEAAATQEVASARTRSGRASAVVDPSGAHSDSTIMAMPRRTTRSRCDLRARGWKVRVRPPSRVRMFACAMHRRHRSSKHPTTMFALADRPSIARCHLETALNGSLSKSRAVLCVDEPYSFALRRERFPSVGAWRFCF